MEPYDTTKPIPVSCDYCAKEFSSSTILFHQKKHHADLPNKYTPNKIQCQKCFETIQLINIFFHNATCDKRQKKSGLLTITEEKDPDKPACRHCKRKFTTTRLEKHESACETASKKRPIFDILRKRIPYIDSVKEKVKSRRSEVNLKYPNSKWQKQHIQMLKNLRIENEVTFYDDFITCPHCMRRFAPVSADKHIEICKSIFNKPRPPPSVLRNLPDLKSKVKPFTVKTHSLKSLSRPYSVLCKSRDKGLGILSTSIDDTSSPEISPGRLLKEANPSVRESRSLSNSKKVHRFSAFDLANKLRPNSTVRSSKNIKSASCVSNIQSNKNIQNIQNIQSININQSRRESKVKMKTFEQKRSQSIQKISDVITCHACRCIIPSIAKFCSMCGVIRIN